MHRSRGAVSPPRLRFAGRTAEPAVGKSVGPLLYKMQKTESKLIRRVLEFHGFEETNGSDWNLMWMGVHLKPYMMSGLHKYQKINHFPRTYELTRKDKMYANIKRMRDKFGPKPWDFCPRTFNLPLEWNLFLDDYNRDPGDGTWIVKPNASSRGRGIHLVSHPGELSREDNCVVSRYVANPLLIDGFKFDLRIYVLVTSFDPLRVYMYNEGLCRFATEKYDSRASSFDNRNVHLTNYSINKHSSNFVRNEDADVDDCGHKWSLSALRRRLQEMGIDVEAVWADIHSLVIKTLISVESTVVPALKTFVPHSGNCFELLGFDVLIADNLKPWLVEVNLSPSLGTDSPLDRRIKNKLVANMFDLVGIQQFNRTQARADKISVGQRHKANGSRRPWSAANSSRRDGRLSSEAAEVLQQTRDEYSRRGDFVRIFPCADGRSYLRFFEVPRAHNLMLLDFINSDSSQYDPHPYRDELSGYEQRMAADVTQVAMMTGEISEGEDEELLTEDESATEEEMEDVPDVAEPEPEPEPDNLYARRAVEEFLSCLIDRLSQRTSTDTTQRTVTDTAARASRQLCDVADQTISQLSNESLPSGLNSNSNQSAQRAGQLEWLLTQYKRRSDRMAVGAAPMTPELQQAADGHLDRFRRELSLASVTDLSRFLQRFVGEMPKMPLQKPLIQPQQQQRPRTVGRPASPQFPGQLASSGKVRPSTVGPLGRKASSGEQSTAGLSRLALSERSAIARGARSSDTSDTSDTTSDRLIIHPRTSSARQPAVFVKPSRPWSAEQSSRRRPQRTSKSGALHGATKAAYGPLVGGSVHGAKSGGQLNGSSFAERIRQLTSSAQLHPRPKRPQSAKTAVRPMFN